MNASRMLDLYHGAVDRASTTNGLLTLVGTGAIICLGSYIILRPAGKGRPSSFGLKGGHLKGRGGMDNGYKKFSSAYGTEDGEFGMKKEDDERVPSQVDTFYNLVTDFYEWGWGLSFHFSPTLPGMSLHLSEVVHEARVAASLRLKPGMQCADFGCGVGGPMRMIACMSGAHIRGITVNSYQVERCNKHNKQLGVDSLCCAEEGNFLNLTQADNTFDAAYAIEATCHAPKVEEAYAEILRVLKPGALFCTYEWVSTTLFDPSNKDHVRIIDGIVFGNGLPTMRSAAQCAEAAKKAGFEVVEDIDLATASSLALPWYIKLQRINSTIWINYAIVNSLAFLRLLPKGVKDVHNMLCGTAKCLVEGGETGVFSPMHMLLLRKPVKPAPKGA